MSEPTNHYATIDGVTIRYQRIGKGDSKSDPNDPIVLLHGSFLNLHSWREVMHPLSRHGQVVAFDRPAFGMTERPLLAGEHERHSERNPYGPEGQADRTIGMLDHLGIERAILVGNSTGATVALLTALRHPDRVSALILVGAMVYSGYPVSEMPPLVRRLIPTWFGAGVVKQIVSRALPSIIRSFWYDKERVTPAILAYYRPLIEADHWNTALWELISATHRLHLAEQLSSLQIPAFVVSGEHDHTVPLEQSIRLSQDLPNADLAVLPGCAHVPQEECPDGFLHAVERFLAKG